jgi:hypothetical protein
MGAPAPSAFFADVRRLLEGFRLAALSGFFSAYGLENFSINNT